MAVVYLTCSYCRAPYETTEGKHGVALKRGQTRFYCSPKCVGLARRVASTTCDKCGLLLSRTRGGRWRCASCARPVGLAIGPRTKGDLFASRRNWQSARSAIQKMARSVFFAANPNPSCVAVEDTGICGYSKHVEVSHRRDVMSFPDTATINEINDLANLVGLCPTHHWEFDHQRLKNPLP